METRICTVCKETKPLSDFHSSPSGLYKKTSRCKDCRNKTNRLYYATKKMTEKDFMFRRKRNNPALALFWSCRDRAKRKNIPFDITLEDIIIPNLCPVLGIPLDNALGKGIGTPDNSASVDRIIPEKGYTKGNILVVSSRANRIKTNSTVDELGKVYHFYKNLLDG